MSFYTDASYSTAHGSKIVKPDQTTGYLVFYVSLSHNTLYQHVNFIIQRFALSLQEPILTSLRSRGYGAFRHCSGIREKQIGGMTVKESLKLWLLPLLWSYLLLPPFMQGTLRLPTCQCVITKKGSSACENHPHHKNNKQHLPRSTPGG